MKVLAAAVALSAVAACADRTPPREPSTTTADTTYTTNAPVQHQPVQHHAYARDGGSTDSVPQTTVSPFGDTSMAARSETSPIPESATVGTGATDRASTPIGSRSVVDGSEPARTDTTAPTRPVDNTKNNERDRHGTLTPGDQGNSRSETKITADVRKGLMASKNLSFTAKNAKIITNGTKVTLRGVVKTDAEKTEIEQVAKSTAGVAEVDNQLEVKK